MQEATTRSQSVARDTVALEAKVPPSTDGGVLLDDRRREPPDKVLRVFFRGAGCPVVFEAFKGVAGDEPPCGPKKGSAVGEEFEGDGSTGDGDDHAVCVVRQVFCKAQELLELICKGKPGLVERACLGGETVPGGFPVHLVPDGPLIAPVPGRTPKQGVNGAGLQPPAGQVRGGGRAREPGASAPATPLHALHR